MLVVDIIACLFRLGRETQIFNFACSVWAGLRVLLISAIGILYFKERSCKHGYTMPNHAYYSEH